MGNDRDGTESREMGVARMFSFNPTRVAARVAAVFALQVALAPASALALDYQRICGNPISGAPQNSQIVAYCSAADSAKKAAADQRILTYLYSAASAVCMTACAAQFAPFMQGAAQSLSVACSGMNVVEGGTESILSRNLAQGLIGLFTGGVGLAADLKLLGEYRYQNQTYEDGFQLAHEDYERMLLGLSAEDDSALPDVDLPAFALGAPVRIRPVLLADSSENTGPVMPVTSLPVSQTTNTVVTQAPNLANSVGTIAGGNAKNVVQKAAPCFTAAVDIYQTYVKANLVAQDDDAMSKNLQSARQLLSATRSRWDLIPSVVASELAIAPSPSRVPPGYFSRPECSSSVSALLDCAQPVAPGLPTGLATGKFQDLFLRISGVSLEDFMKQGDVPPARLLEAATARAFAPNGRDRLGQLIASVEPDLVHAASLAAKSALSPVDGAERLAASPSGGDGAGGQSYLSSGTGSGAIRAPAEAPAGSLRADDAGMSLFDRVSRTYRLKFLDPGSSSQGQTL